MKMPTSIWLINKHPKDKIFLGREYRSIKGTKNSTLVMLSLMLFLSLFSIILGKAGLDYLNYKMNDPFIKWFNIAPTMDEYADMKARFDRSVQSNEYSISESTGAYRGMWRFYKCENVGSTYGFVQSFSYWNDQQLWKSILFDGNNLLHAYTNLAQLSSDELQDGIIITQKLMMEMQADPSSLQDQKVMVKNGDNLPLRVLAVVRTLPNRSHVFAENCLVFCLSKSDNCEPSGSPYERSGLLEIYIRGDEANTDKIYDRLRTELENMNLGLDLVDYQVKHQNLAIASHNVHYSIRLSNEIDNRLRQKIQEELTKVLLDFNPAVGFVHSLSVPHSQQEFGVPPGVGNSDLMFDLLSVKVDDPAYIPSFQEMMFEKYRIELDMNQVEAKKNFFVVSFLAIFLILSLVFFAGFAILVYLYNLMKSHLEKIKMNIGTFLAFGMPRTFLFNGYMSIILRLMVTATAISLGAILLLDVLVLSPLGSRGISELEFLNYTKVLGNLWIWTAIVLFFTISFLLFRSQLRTFLTHPPGDLIYGRK